MTTLQQFSQPVTSLPLEQPQKLPNISLKTKDNLYLLGIIAGTIFTAISQQAALTSIPLLGLLLMHRANQQHLTLAQKQQHQQLTTVVERSFHSLSTQIKQQQQLTTVVERSLSYLSNEIQQLETQIKETEVLSQNYLTKTHLTPIITKLHQLQQENKHFKLKELGTLAQHLNDCTNQIKNLQESRQKLEKQFQQVFSQTQPIHQPKLPSNPLLGNNRVAIFIDGANLYHSATQLGLQPPDYEPLLTFLKSQSSSSQAFFYTGIDSTNPQRQKFLFRLQRLGCQIIGKEVIKRADGSRKANLDVELALDLVELANTYDTAILASGDGDFALAIQRIQHLGKRVEVVSYRATTSQKLMELADDYFDLENITGVA
jgi:uncharacterized LabA/DUF88 family protein